MKVKITDWTEDKYYWYKSRIGEVFEVKEDSNNSNYYCTSTGARIAKSDTIPVNEIKYELESNVRCDTCVTSCEYKKNTMVGSVGCSKCEYNCGDDKTSQTVQCSWQMEGKEMKRLEVSLKIQPDGKTVVAECTHIADELRGKGLLAEKGMCDIGSWTSISVCPRRLYVRGNNKVEDYKIHSLVFYTPQEAQEYVKIMNELIDEVNNPNINWNSVEEGAEVTWIEELVYNSLAEVKIKANFHSYIPKMNKVVVIIGDEVKVVDEDKVELV